jgi:Ran-binding protein 1
MNTQRSYCLTNLTTLLFLLIITHFAFSSTTSLIAPLSTECRASLIQSIIEKHILDVETSTVLACKDNELHVAKHVLSNKDASTELLDYWRLISDKNIDLNTKMNSNHYAMHRLSPDCKIQCLAVLFSERLDENTKVKARRDLAMKRECTSSIEWFYPLVNYLSTVTTVDHPHAAFAKKYMSGIDSVGTINDALKQLEQQEKGSDIQQQKQQSAFASAISTIQSISIKNPVLRSIIDRLSVLPLWQQGAIVLSSIVFVVAAIINIESVAFFSTVLFALALKILELYDNKALVHMFKLGLYISTALLLSLQFIRINNASRLYNTAVTMLILGGLSYNSHIAGVLGALGYSFLITRLLFNYLFRSKSYNPTDFISDEFAAIIDSWISVVENDFVQNQILSRETTTKTKVTKPVQQTTEKVKPKEQSTITNVEIPSPPDLATIAPQPQQPQNNNLVDLLDSINHRSQTDNNEVRRTRVRKDKSQETDKRQSVDEAMQQILSSINTQTRAPKSERVSQVSAPDLMKVLRVKPLTASLQAKPTVETKPVSVTHKVEEPIRIVKPVEVKPVTNIKPQQETIKVPQQVQKVEKEPVQPVVPSNQTFSKPTPVKKEEPVKETLVQPVKVPQQVQVKEEPVQPLVTNTSQATISQPTPVKKDEVQSEAKIEPPSVQQKEEIKESKKKSKKEKAEAEDYNPEEECTAEFKPLVDLSTLPEIQVKTFEEDEDVLFACKSKLLRYDNGEWKEKGVGTLKILQNRENNDKIRVLMRRDQTLKICANHYINPQIELKTNSGNDKSWVYTAPMDYSDPAKPQTEVLCIRFQSIDSAKEFEQVFNNSKQTISEIAPSIPEVSESSIIEPEDEESESDQEEETTVNNSVPEEVVKSDKVSQNVVSEPQSSTSDGFSSFANINPFSSGFSINEEPTGFTGHSFSDFASSGSGHSFSDFSNFAHDNNAGESNTGGFTFASTLNDNVDNNQGGFTGFSGFGGFGASDASSGFSGFGGFANDNSNSSGFQWADSQQKPEEIEQTPEPKQESEKNQAKVEQPATEQQPVPESESDESKPKKKEKKSKKSEEEVHPEDEECTAEFKPLVDLSTMPEIDVNPDANFDTLLEVKAKLSRFDNINREWKDKGTGVAKIQQHQTTKRWIRVLMRRDQTLKICANHYIIPEMELKPIVGNDRAVMYTAQDFSGEEQREQEEQEKIEILSFRFRTVSDADDFKRVFDEARHIVADLTDTVVTEPTPSQSTPQQQQRKEETHEEELQQTEPATIEDKQPETLAPQFNTSPFTFGDSSFGSGIASTESSGFGSGFAAAFGTSNTSSEPITFGDTGTNLGSFGSNFASSDSDDTTSSDSSQPVSAFGSFGSSESFGEFGSSGSFGSFGSSAFSTFTASDSSSFQGNTIFGTNTDTSSQVEETVTTADDDSSKKKKKKFKQDENYDPENPEEEVNIEFKPLVDLSTMPEIETKSEETEDVLFQSDAKLFRKDPETKEWKERGLGELKILQHKINKDKIRILMRRRQTLKVCANHAILPYMNLVGKEADDRIKVYKTHADFSEEEPRSEVLSVRFRFSEQAKEFDRVFNEAKQTIQNLQSGSVSDESAKQQTTEEEEDESATVIQPVEPNVQNKSDEHNENNIWEDRKRPPLQVVTKPKRNLAIRKPTTGNVSKTLDSLPTELSFQDITHDAVESRMSSQHSEDQTFEEESHEEETHVPKAAKFGGVALPGLGAELSSVLKKRQQDQ